VLKQDHITQSRRLNAQQRAARLERRAHHTQGVPDAQRAGKASEFDLLKKVGRVRLHYPTAGNCALLAHISAILGGSQHIGAKGEGAAQGYACTAQLQGGPVQAEMLIGRAR
jgi:hypothetical protein